MKTEYLLKYLLDYLNNIRSLVIIEFYNPKTGTALLSNGLTIPLRKFETAADLERWLSR